ncbi:hypothetical protein Bbelb_305350 [Branchiostoma belcheri]|nr:hypothetical protein Bbelb_305350 [Branchiostoma belcheri]
MGLCSLGTKPLVGLASHDGNPRIVVTTTSDPIVRSFSGGSEEDFPSSKVNRRRRRKWEPAVAHNDCRAIEYRRQSKVGLSAEEISLSSRRSDYQARGSAFSACSQGLTVSSDAVRGWGRGVWSLHNCPHPRHTSSYLIPIQTLGSPILWVGQFGRTP